MPKHAKWRAGMTAGAAALAAGLLHLLIVFTPSAPPLASLSIAFVALMLTAAFTSCCDAKTLRFFAPLLAAAALAANAAPFATRDAARLSLASGLVSLALILAILADFLRSPRTRPASKGDIAVVHAVVAALAAYSLYRLMAAKMPMFSDFMACRLLSIEVARAIRAGEAAAILPVFIKSFSSEYSLLPALAPGLALTASAPLSRAVYQVAIAVFYAAPAFLALGALATKIARRAGASPGGAAALALATGFALAAAPAALTLVTLGMPDIGGLALVVAGLLLSERLARLLALPPGREEFVERETIRTGLQLAALIFAMFLFRRWYVFSAVGLLAAAAIEIALLAATRGKEFRWRATIAAGAASGLTLLALVMPVLIDWLPDWRGHDYRAIYAAYDYDLAELLRRIGDFYGFALPAAALASAAFLATRGTNNRPLRLTLTSTAIAFAAMLFVQSPGPHHLYLLAPALTAPIGAAALIAFERRRRAMFAALFTLLAVTLTPAATAFPQNNLFARASLLPGPRADLSELLRLRGWIGAHATPERRYCVLASSEIVSGVLVDQLWQLDPVRAPMFGAGDRNDILLPSVDGRDGPPGESLKNCAWMLVGDPVQTALPREFQVSVAIPARELLEGEGIGKNFRRTGDVFALEGGVSLVAFERMAPLSDEELAALGARWSLAPRGDAARRAVERFL